MPFRLMAHHTENQIQQARVIFNPLTDIFTKCFSFYFIVISLPLQDLNFVRKKLKVIMEDPQNWCSRNVSRRRVDFLGDSSRRFRKFWMFSGILAERCRPLWPLWTSATLPVFRNLATKCWIVLLTGTLFLPKSLLHCRCVRRTDFVAKYPSIIFIRWKTWTQKKIGLILESCFL